MPVTLRFVINTAQFDASVAFWTTILGLARSGGWDRGPDDRGALIEVAAGGVIEIVDHGAQARTPRYDDQAVAIEYEHESEIDARRERALRRGAVVSEPAHQSWGHYSCSLRDPDGLEVVLWCPSARQAGDPSGQR